MTTNETMPRGPVDPAAVLPIERFRNLSGMALSSIRRIYETVPPTRQTLALLFAVDSAQTNPTEAWIGFFVETACSQLIWDERPTGTLTADQARWVLQRFDEAPRLSLLALLVRLLEDAACKPNDFDAEVRRRATMCGEQIEAGRHRTQVPYLRLVA